ncbi:MAG: PilW family protein [Calditrichia bacterium]
MNSLLIEYQNHPIRNEKGYTLIELLIAMQLAMMIIGLAVWGYGFTTKVLNKWQQNVVSQIELIRLENSIRIPLNRILIIKQADERFLAGQTCDGSKIIIKHDTSSLQFNSKVITGIKKHRIRYHLGNNNDITMVESVPKAWLKHIRAIEVELHPTLENAKPIRFLQRIKWGKI